MKYNNLINYERLYTNKLSVNPNYRNFYIEGICHNGSRHYSEDMTYEDALTAMPRYNGVVQYFGGGVVKLIEKPNRCLKFKNS